MGILAWVSGGIGGLCLVMGVLTATEIVPLLYTGLDTMFWLVVSVILLLVCIAFAVSRSGYE